MSETDEKFYGMSEALLKAEQRGHQRGLEEAAKVAEEEAKRWGAKEASSAWLVADAVRALLQ